MFVQDELRKFIKFACNQERIPFGHPCRDRSKDSALHVPPYPMKIAPPDGRGEFQFPCAATLKLCVCGGGCSCILVRGSDCFKMVWLVALAEVVGR